ncbi:MAG: N-methyl-L-tryptophan oxidase [Litorilinea sp.]
MRIAEPGPNRKNQCECAPVSDAPVYDTIVVGGGGIGCAAAYHLAKDGGKVLLLEQFEIGHTRGSSHGGSRIIRYTHDTTAYAQQMPQTFALWRQLERESGEALLQMSGGLYMGPVDQPFLVGAQAALAALDFPFRVYTPGELAAVYPQFRLPAAWIALEQAHTGMLAASRCVATLARQAVEHGATLYTHTRVTALTPGAAADGGVTVTTAGPGGTRTFTAAQVVICAGPWASRFLSEWLPQPPTLRVTHQQVAYYPAPEPAAYAPGRFPVFLCAGENFIYGLPAWERAGAIKVALEQEARTIDPEQPDRPIDTHLLESLNQAVAYYLPAIDPTPVHVDTCLYTETPTRDFIIDRLPGCPQAVIAAGFSGRGFKHTIAIGRLLADMIQSGPGPVQSDFWLDAYRLDNHLLQPHAAGSNLL